MTTRQETTQIVRDETGEIVVFIAHDKNRKNIVYIPKEASAEQIASFISDKVRDEH